MENDAIEILHARCLIGAQNQFGHYVRDRAKAVELCKGHKHDWIYRSCIRAFAGEVYANRRFGKHEFIRVFYCGRCRAEIDVIGISNKQIIKIQNHRKIMLRFGKQFNGMLMLSLVDSIRR